MTAILAHTAQTLGLAALLLAGASTAQASDWQAYDNPRFGFSVEVPPGWNAQPPSDNGDGQVWTAPDGKGEIRAWGAFRDTAESLEDAMEAAGTASDGETVTYRRRKAGEIVVSGLGAGAIFYKRAVLTCRDGLWTTVLLTYPEAQKKAYDAIVARVARSLKGGRAC